MTLLEWVGVYVGNLIFWLWILRWRGAEMLEDSFFAGIISIFAVKWDAAGIKLFGLISLIGTTIWFFVGLFKPEARVLW